MHARHLGIIFLFCLTFTVLLINSCWQCNQIIIHRSLRKTFNISESKNNRTILCFRWRWNDETTFISEKRGVLTSKPYKGCKSSRAVDPGHFPTQVFGSCLKIKGKPCHFNLATIQYCKLISLFGAPNSAVDSSRFEFNKLVSSFPPYRNPCLQPILLFLFDIIHFLNRLGDEANNFSQLGSYLLRLCNPVI